MTNRDPTKCLALNIDPLVNRIAAFGEILMALGGDPNGGTTPSSLCLIGGDITEATDRISEMIVAALRDGKTEDV